VLCVIADHRRQQLAGDERRRAYCDAAVRDGCSAADHRRRSLQLEQAAVRDWQELGAEFGERDLAGRAVEQAESELPSSSRTSTLIPDCVMNSCSAAREKL